MTRTDETEQIRRLDDLMARMQRVMSMKAGPAQFLGLTATQAFILRYLSKHEMTKASDLARAVGLSPGAVTQVCDELVKNQMITRLRSESDRRVVHIELTEEGASMLERIRSAHAEHMYEIVRLLGHPDADEFVRLLGRVVDIVETLDKE